MQIYYSLFENMFFDLLILCNKNGGLEFLNILLKEMNQKIKITQKIIYLKLFLLLLLSDVGHIDFMLGLFCE